MESLHLSQQKAEKVSLFDILTFILPYSYKSSYASMRMYVNNMFLYFIYSYLRDSIMQVLNVIYISIRPPVDKSWDHIIKFL